MASTIFNKHKYYEKSVQNPQAEIEFLNEKFQELKGRKPFSLKEDFGGTGLLACRWVTQSSKHQAWAIDLDSHPIDYGKKNHLSKLTVAEQKRVHYLQKNVLEVIKPQVDICVAFNFSYFIFKKRQELLKYFKQSRKGIKENGVFFIDLFGGENAQELVEEETDFGSFKYYWDCKKFNPINNECFFAIHFKMKGQRKIKDAFTYDWRLWSLPELRDLLQQAGFSKTVAYWEGEDADGEGNGEFYPTEDAENCESWVTYIAAMP